MCVIAAGVCVSRGRGTIETDGYGNERKRTEKWCATGYSVGLLAAVWCGSGEERPQGYAWQLDGSGGMRRRGGATLKSDLSDLSDLSDKKRGVM